MACTRIGVHSNWRALELACAFSFCKQIALATADICFDFLRRPGHWNVDAVRHHTLDSDLMVSPGCSRNGSSDFSSGEASTNSSATTPPPLITNHILESKSILEEPELQNAPWFQDAMPRYVHHHP